MKACAIIAVLAGVVPLPSPAQRVLRIPDSGSMPDMTPTAYLRTSLIIGGKRHELTLIGRTPEAVVTTKTRDGSGTRNTIPVGRIEGARFDVDIDGRELNEAIGDEDWTGAVRISFSAIKPMLPYLDIPNNNATPLAAETGEWMLRSAKTLATDGGAASPQAKRYRAASALLSRVGAAHWFDGADLAAAQAARCLWLAGDAGRARAALEALEAPMVTDAHYGFYWLLRARLDHRDGKIQDALDATVNAVAFADKNIDTFPDSLLLSGDCYERLEEWHRARDVYYEVARVFPKTEWSATARERLRRIINEGQTDKDEDTTVEDVFFGLKEDMNALSRTLLAEPEPAIR